MKRISIISNTESDEILKSVINNDRKDKRIMNVNNGGDEQNGLLSLGCKYNVRIY